MWKQIITNSDGKISNTGFCGFIIVLIGSISFLISMVGWIIKIPESTSVMGNIVLLITIGSGLLATRKIVGGKPEVKDETNVG